MTKILTTLLIALFSIACGPGSGPTTVQGLMLSVNDCVNPTAAPFYADGTDVLDDRVAIQAAVNAACARPLGQREVCFPPGEFLATRNPALGSTNLASIQLRCEGIEITGAGRYATTIGMLGSGVDPIDPRGPNDWWLIDLQGPQLSGVRSIGLSGARRYDTHEQTHLLQLKGPLGSAMEPKGPEVEDVLTVMPTQRWPEGSVPCLLAPDGAQCEMPLHGGGAMLCHPFQENGAWRLDALIGGACSVSTGIDGTQRWSLLGWFSGGDCVRLLGEFPEDTGGVDQLIYNATIRDWAAPDCDRSALGLQRGHVDTVLEDAELVTFDDQVVDSEPTGHRGFTIKSVRGVHVSRGVDNGGLTVSVSGSSQGTTTVKEWDCNGSRIPHGGTRTFDVEEVTFKNCHFDSGTITSEPTFGILKRAKRVRIIGGSMRRPAGAPPNAVLDVTHQAGASATTLMLEGVTLYQGTVSPVIKVQSLRNLTLRDVKLVYTGPSWAGPAIVAETHVAPVDAISLAGVELEAPPGALAGLLWAPPSAGVSLVDVLVKPGSIRTAVVTWHGGIGQALHAVNVEALGLASVAFGAQPALCGGGCPSP